MLAKGEISIEEFYEFRQEIENIPLQFDFKMEYEFRVDKTVENAFYSGP